MTKSLHIAPGLELPLDFITQAAALLGMRGGGKSNAAALFAEAMYDAGLPFVVIDPEGSWYGLRVGKNALSIPIFGGEHGDVPLEPQSGKLVARLVAEQRLCCIIDTSELSETAKRGFLADFGEELYRRNRDPLHLILEEADDYLPQRVDGERARTLRAWETIVRRGRKRGLGCTMVTQRSASIAKDVLTQVDTLFVLRTTAPQDHAAIEGWLKYHGQSKEVMASLPQLKAGECWVWSPSYLQLLKKVQLPRRRTFDSGATPTHLDGKRPVATLASVDLDAIKKEMTATIERAKSDDPRLLKKRIVDLERELAKQPAEVAPQRIEVPAISKGELADLAALRDDFRAFAVKMDAYGNALGSALETAKAIAQKQTVPVRPPPPVFAASVSRLAARHAQPKSAPSNGSLPKGERLVLIAVAQNRTGVSREQITVLTGYKRSTRDTYIQRLREKSYIDDGGIAINVTAEGAEALGSDYEPLPTGDALLDYWRNRLPEGERKVLDVVIEYHPRGVDREAIDAATGYARSSRDTYIQRLRTRKLVNTSGGAVTASEELFG